MSNIKMKNEFYKIELIFNQVAENSYNMERGNIYVSAKFKS